MMNIRGVFLAISVAMAAVAPMSVIDRANAATAQDLNAEADHALQLLYQTNPVALDISKKAKGVLVFPNIVKAGFVFGAAYGEGVLKQGSKIDGYYNSFTGSLGSAGGRPIIRIRRVSDEPEGNQLHPPLAGLGDRRRADGRRREPGRCQESVHIDAEG